MKKLLILLLVLLLMLSLVATAQEKPYEGVTLKWLTGAGHNAYAGHVAKDLAAQLGITLEQIEQSDDQIYALAMKDWQAGGGSYDIVTLFPRNNAEFIGLGYVIPINEYLDKFNAWDNYNNIIEIYRKLYTEWDGKVYAFVQDGDVAQMYTRKDVFANTDLQAEFKQKYGYDFETPETFDQMFDIAEFLNGRDVDNDGQPNYGLQINSWQRADLETIFLPIFGSYGGQYFDEEMNPLINSQAGVDTLETIKKILSYSPPGSVTMGWSETMTSFVEGQVVMTLWYPDIGRAMLNPTSWGGKGGLHWKGKIGYELWPGVKLEDGTIRRYASMCHGRIQAITQYCENPEAAFALLELLARPENAIKTTAFSESGSDPWQSSMADINVWGDYPVEQEWIVNHLRSLSYGMPEIQLPGNQEYYDSLRSGIQTYITGVEKDPKKVLDQVAAEWKAVADRWGIAQQKEIWLKQLLRNEEVFSK